MTLTTTQKSIDALLTGDRQYQIPDFQRPYVWEEPQAIALVNDLLGAWRTNDGDYFLGSVVLVQHPSGDDVDIIDGQQRMTTLCILLALLRHLAGVGSGLHGDLSKRLSIAESTFKGLDERPRLLVRECDREFFDTFIVDDNIDSLLDVDASALTPASVRRINDNARAMLDVLSDPDVLAPDEVQRRTPLPRGPAPPPRAAPRFFAVLNTRGVPLSAADIFKARVLAHVESDARVRYAALWEQSIDSLGTENPDAFFGHLLTLALRSPAKRALIDAFGEQVLTPFLASKSGEEFIDEVVVPNARAYSLATLEPLAGHPAATSLQLLRLYEASDWKPAAMAILSVERSDEEVASLMSSLERLYGTAVAARLIPSSRESIIAKFIAAVEDGESITAACAVSDDTRHRAAKTLSSALPQSSLRKVLLYHAMVADQGGFPARLPRSLGVLAGLPAAPPPRRGRAGGAPPPGDPRRRGGRGSSYLEQASGRPGSDDHQITHRQPGTRLGHCVARTPRSTDGRRAHRRHAALRRGRDQHRRPRAASDPPDAQHPGLLGHSPRFRWRGSVSLVQLRAGGRRRQAFRRARPPSAPGRRRRNRHHLPR